MAQLPNGKWSGVAWQGLRFRIPFDWNPLEITGVRAKGALRIGTLERTTMEVIWQSPGRFDTNRRVWNRYLKQLRIKSREASKHRANCFKYTDALRHTGWRQPIAIRLDDDDRTSSIHMLMQGIHTDRFILIRMALDQGKNEKHTVDSILASLRETDPSSRESWSIYGFSVQVPEGANLVDAQMQPGHLRLRFRCRLIAMTWQRISFGQRTLSGQSLGDWHSQQILEKRKRRPWRPGPSVARGGHSLRRVSVISRVMPRPWRKQARSAAWHEKDSDQLVLLTVKGCFDRVDSIFTEIGESWRVAGE